MHRHEHEDDIVIRPPPQPESPRTPVQRHRPPSYSPPPRTPAGNHRVYAPPPGPPPAHLVAKYAREKELRQNNLREERRLRELHHAIENAC